MKQISYNNDDSLVLSANKQKYQQKLHNICVFVRQDFLRICDKNIVKIAFLSYLYETDSRYSGTNVNTGFLLLCRYLSEHTQIISHR